MVVMAGGSMGSPYSATADQDLFRTGPHIHNDFGHGDQSSLPLQEKQANVCSGE